MVKRSSIIFHITGWLIFLSLPAFFLIGQAGDAETGNHLPRVIYWLFFLSYIVIFYGHTYFLFPGLFLKQRYIAYAVALLLLFAGIFYLRPFDRMAQGNRDATVLHSQAPPASFPGPPPGNAQRGPVMDIISIALFILVIALSISLVTVQRWRTTAAMAAKAEAGKVQAELSFLKAQINPHFLFNTLNNIYTMAVTKDEQTPEAIMKLSNIMRYTTDEVLSDFVPLQAEVDCIINYIDLQKLRLSKHTTVELLLEGDFNSQQLPPLVLMTFIENMFKYGISNNAPGVLKIRLTATGNRLELECSNRIFAQQTAVESTGIGIVNTRKRLEQLYPGKHDLQVQAINDFYTVHLLLQV